MIDYYQTCTVGEVPYVIRVSDCAGDITDTKWDKEKDINVVLCVPAVLTKDWMTVLTPTKVENTIYDTRFHFNETYSTFAEISDFISNLKNLVNDTLPDALDWVDVVKDTDAHVFVTGEFISVCLSFIDTYGEDLVAITENIGISILPEGSSPKLYTLTITSDSDAFDVESLLRSPISHEIVDDKCVITYLIKQNDDCTFDDTAGSIANSLFAAIVNGERFRSIKDPLIKNKDAVKAYGGYSDIINAVAKEFFSDYHDELSSDDLELLSSLTITSSIDVDKDTGGINRYMLHLLVDLDLFNEEDLRAISNEESEGKRKLTFQLTVDPELEALEKEILDILGIFKTLCDAKLAKNNL